MQTHNSISEFLSSELPRLRPNYRVNPVQIAYAQSISQSLAAGPGKFNFIEGDTGIGKSLGYLLTVGDWIARGKNEGRHGVISTYSRALQRQLISPENQDLLNEYLSLQGLPSLRIAVRMGKSNYVSLERLSAALDVENLITASSSEEFPLKVRKLAQWALESDGCLLDLQEDELPTGLNFSDIALHESDPIPEYLVKHFDDVQRADILVINHALLTVDLITNQAVTGAEAPYILLLDEAEHFPEVAKGQLSRRLSFSMARSILSQIGLKTVADKWRVLLHAYRDERSAGEAIPVDTRATLSLKEGLQAILKARPRKHNLEDRHIKHEWDRLRREAKDMLEALDVDSPSVALTFSPIKGLPSLVGYQGNEGGVLKAGASNRITILTSATLSDLGHKPGEPASFQFLRSELVMKATDTRLGIQHSHQALDFGSLLFSLPRAPAAPLESLGNGSFRLNPRYVHHAWQSIGRVSEGRTLVLCVSYQDVETLLESCPIELKERIVSHSSGAPLNQIAGDMPRDGILLTPAGWEGLSPSRDSDQAFWKHVVLLRNPTPRPDPVVELVLLRHMMNRNSPVEARSMARRGLMFKNLIRTLYKIRQGLGRTIRHPEDEVLVSILDPRFPQPRTTPPAGVKVSPRLVGAIPARFLAAYDGCGADSFELEPKDEGGTSQLIL